MNYLIYFFIFVFGLLIGSFLNCLIWRLHKEETILGRSYCPKCRHKIFWYDNLPLLSFIFLKGRCRHCGKLISWQYPLVELSTGILFVLTFILIFYNSNANSIFQFFPPWRDPAWAVAIFDLIVLIRNWLIICIMTIIFIYDLRWYLILDKVTLPACAIVFGLNISLGFLAGNGLTSLWLIFFSGIIGGSFFLIQYIVSRGRWVGGGDIRLGLLMGIILGWPGILAGLFIAYISGALFSIPLLIFKKKKWGSKIPFGTFLSVATLVALFFGKQLLAWYLQTFIYLY